MAIKWSEMNYDVRQATIKYIRGEVNRLRAHNDPIHRTVIADHLSAAADELENPTWDEGEPLPGEPVR